MKGTTDCITQATAGFVSDRTSGIRGTQDCITDNETQGG